MNYAIKTYGPFDTGNDKNSYNDYHIWNKNNEIVSYKRDIGLEIFEEEITFVKLDINSFNFSE